MGAVHVDPLRRSLTGVVTALLAALTIAAGVYFATSATRGVSDPRPEMVATLDRFEPPAGARELHQRFTGGMVCDDTGCPAVDRYWEVPMPVAATCPAARRAVGAWGGIRFQQLGTVDCGYLGVMGPYRLSFSVESAQRARLPDGVAPPADGSVLRIGLVRD